MLLMTDQPSHLALDSRLAGIVVPHDGLCHLENSVYTGSTTMVRTRWKLPEGYASGSTDTEMDMHISVRLKYKRIQSLKREQEVVTFCSVK